MGPRSLLACGVVLAGLAAAPRAHGGVTLRQGKELKLDLGALLHTFVVASGANAPLAGTSPGELQPVLRRARLRVEATLWERFVILLQTDRGTGESGSGVTFNLIDAYARLQVAELLQVTAGLHLPPGPRITNESSSNLLTIDRPSQAFKSLSWGLRTLVQFDRLTLESSDPGLRTGAPVRDLGVTVHGHGSLTPRLHAKYAVGVYEGIPRPFSTAPHITARVQMNVGEPEPGLIVRGNYGGTKRVAALGAFFAAQPDIAETTTGGRASYRHGGVDVFFEQPVGPVAVTLEVAAQYLELGGGAVAVAGRPLPVDLRRTEGFGAYGQVGVLLGPWQPWFGAETFRATAPGGSFSALRVGANYYFVPERVSLRGGYELFGAPASDVAGERSVHSASLGVYLAF